MIKREFEINDIAYLAKDRRIKVHVDGSDTYTKNISLKAGDAVKILDFYEIDKYGYSYEAEFKKDGTSYIIKKHLSQSDLRPKNEI
ncbi:hypothetical protein [Romboutsia lituseburensis]|uniref:Uncharacterized protein n=1 Tax=Romboutsia lituseburensis DSM 797 TaxID=1121325 RepID=A0A1G9KBF8_9FIRM|nr:hypothetical protein [Romboutsia lituseburensis]CEH34832.1 Hypothetical protein RLITU_2250 [Romboutsia lituseburensis]SDL46725.1 hypothetical protein SAMN04515677_10270 [Romboutsia lituseburensis DSM 797]